MFQLFIALKYLIPRKQHLSTALISLMSTIVISLVVWLVVVFLSVTEGIEKNWLNKLTTLNAPLRISPTSTYFSSYYYLVDSIATSSNFTSKSISEKALASLSDPFDPTIDMEVPAFWPEREVDAKGNPVDPVKKLYQMLNRDFPQITYQDYEISGALLRLAFNRENGKSSFLTQMSYLTTLSDKNPSFASLLMPLRGVDFNNILKNYASADEQEKEYFHAILNNIDLQKVRVKKIPVLLLPKKGSFAATQSGLHIVLNDVFPNGSIFFQNGKPFFKDTVGVITSIPEETLLELKAPLILEATLKEKGKILVNGQLKNVLLSGVIDLQYAEIVDAKVKENSTISLPWITKKNAHSGYALPKIGESYGILLPKNMQDGGALIGDSGYLSYIANNLTSSQEQRLSVFVAGFYDPGVLPTGTRALIVPEDITRTINASSATVAPEGMPINGIYLWTQNLLQAESLKEKLQMSLKKENLDSYWSVASFRDYEFSKDLMQQFQSDRTLFTLIAIIILTVACSNVISLLVLLVNDKKREIAVLQAMGASRFDIGLIFGFCGIFLGAVSTILGTMAATFTLHHINFLVAFLSKIQGHAAFNAAFFGESLPNTLSYEALLFVLIATPIISLLAGLVPAIKASRMHPSAILRSE